ncbi:MAG TPA: hypothetical protein VH475_06585 [Tepidisphaeraceae bacterium]|jgi:hypothetical protein
MSTWRFTFVILLSCLMLAPWSRAKPPEPPEILVPQATLEKLYAAEIPGYKADDYAKLYDAHVWLEKFFRTDSAEDRKAIEKILNASGIPVATLGRMCRIQLGWPALPPGPAYVNERIGPHDVQYFLGVPANYDRSKSWPLVIRLPALGAIMTDPANPPKADEVVKLYAQWTAEELKQHPDAVVVMPLLNFDELYGPSYRGMDSVINAMRHVVSRVNIDATRVDMVGQGMAAHAVWNLALHFPTYFAAINPMAGAASADWQRLRLLNLRNTLPVVWADTTDKVINSNQSGALVSILKNFKYEVIFEQTRNLGHIPSPEIAEKCYREMRARARPLYPQQANLRSNRPDPTFNRVDWMQVYQPVNAGKEHSYLLRKGSGKLIVSDNAHSIQAAFTTPNKIEAKSDNVATLRVYLNDQMVDLKKPVTVIVNGKTRFEGMVNQSLSEMLNDQLFLGRGWRYFTSVVDLDLTESPAGTKPATTKRTIPATGAAVLYFTTDEGKTWFALESSNRPPFVHDGKPAVRAHVFSCDGGKTMFVGYMSKFSPVVEGPLVKRPGGTRWSPVGTGAADLVMDVHCPDGTPAPGKTPVEIFPPSK